MESLPQKIKVRETELYLFLFLLLINCNQNNYKICFSVETKSWSLNCPTGLNQPSTGLYYKDFGVTPTFMQWQKHFATQKGPKRPIINFIKKRSAQDYITRTLVWPLHSAMAEAFCRPSGDGMAPFLARTIRRPRCLTRPVWSIWYQQPSAFVSGVVWTGVGLV